MSRGHLRIYLGAAPGVGKTYAMLDEGFRRRGRGTDVVVGYVETHGRAHTIEQIRDLEIVPRRVIEYRGAQLEEMDVDAVLARRPTVALVDELAHTNVPGSRHAKRWEDVEDLLEAGIDVVTTVNIQHLESVNDVVEQITGVKQHETVPDLVVRAADQVELVDMTPEALRRRLAHGNVYAPEKVDAALANYFRVGNLAALRELALLWVADKVEDTLQQYMEAHGISGMWETRERVVVAMTGAPSGDHLVRRAARMARRSQGDLVGVHVSSGQGLTVPTQTRIEEHRRLLVSLGGAYHEVVGNEVATTLVQFARAEKATQLVLGASRRSRWNELVQGSVINRVLREAGEIDVHVISEETTPPAGLAMPARPTPGHHLPARRRRFGWLLALLGIPVLLAALVLFDAPLGLTSQLLIGLLGVAVVAVVGGRGPGITAAVLSFLGINFLFTEPVHTFTIAEPENTLELVVFLAVAATLSVLVNRLAVRDAAVVRARAEAEALARVAGGLVGEPEPLHHMVEHLRTTFGLDAVAVLTREGERSWWVEAASGRPVPGRPDDGDSLELGGGAVLTLVGPTLSADDRRVLAVFAAQLSSVIETERLRAEAAQASVVAAADALRTAILRAVSHDLRTPLASIKASVTSLLADDVDWSERDRREFLDTIDEETDRLDTLVGNLLDMSRLESGAVEVNVRPTPLEETVAGALASLGPSAVAVEVDISEALPPALADGALLERAVANLVANARRFSPPGVPVQVRAASVREGLDLRVVDRGPGVAPADRARIFEPFQRVGDDNPDGGVGLGLAVAHGFVAAMGGSLALEDTPGGGLTALIALPAAPAATGDTPTPDRTDLDADPREAFAPGSDVAPPATAVPGGST